MTGQDITGFVLQEQGKNKADPAICSFSSSSSIGLTSEFKVRILTDYLSHRSAALPITRSRACTPLVANNNTGV